MILEKLEKTTSLAELYNIKPTLEDFKTITKSGSLDSIIPSMLSNIEKENFIKSDKVSEFIKLIFKKEYEKVIFLLKEGMLEHLSSPQKRMLVTLISSQKQKITQKNEKDKYFELFNFLKNIPKKMDEKSNKIFFNELINNLYIIFSSKNSITNNTNMLMSFLKEYKDIYKKVISEDSENKLLWLVYSSFQDLPLKKVVLSDNLEKRLFAMFDKKNMIDVLNQIIGYRINHSCSQTGKNDFLKFFDEMSEKYQFDEKDFNGIIEHLEGVKDFETANILKLNYANKVKDELIKTYKENIYSPSTKKRM